MAERKTVDESVPTWSHILLISVERLGVPIVLLFFVVYGGFQGAGWLAENVLSPLTTKHIETMDVIQENTARQSAVMETMQQLIAEEHAHGESRTQLLKDILASEMRTAAAIEDLNRTLPREK